MTLAVVQSPLKHTSGTMTEGRRVHLGNYSSTILRPDLIRSLLGEARIARCAASLAGKRMVSCNDDYFGHSK